jgi:DNA-binding transcriptional LysR family regulator
LIHWWGNAMELLNDMALFVEVVKAHSFRRAAEITKVPNSTISRRISLLEKAIGLRLLHRTTRRIELTEAGQLYYERCRRIVDEARLAHEQLGEMLDQPSGLLRLSLPVDFANTYLAPLIAEFAVLYPGISFEFDMTPRRVNLVAEPFDVAIRMGEQEASHLIARPLAKLSAHIYASPTYIEKHGEPDHPSDLVHYQCLCMWNNTVWSLNDGTENVDVDVGGRFKLNNVGMIRRLASLDMGVAILPEEIVSEELPSGRLRRILPEWQGAPTPVYAVTETRLLPAKTQRFIEFLKVKLK